MSSDLTMLTDLVDGLKARLAEALPGWKIRDINDGLLTQAGTVLYYEQSDIANSNEGQRLPAGFIGCDFTLTVVSKYKDPGRGVREVTAASLNLCPALDAMSDVYWTSGQRGVMTTGEPCYVFPIVVLARYTVPTPEPEREPDPATPEPEPTAPAEAPIPEEE